MGPLSALFSYWRGLAICAAGGKYSRLCSALPHLTPQERLCIYSLALHLRLFGDGHYRSGTFQNDLAKNLRNVALPSTGVPLSVFCSCRPLALLFAWFLLPLAALVAAVRRPSSGGGSLGGAFASSLLSDWSWFHYWRLNCVLASYHALATSDPGYGLEDKQVFLAACERQGVAASPSLSDRAIVVKHRNEEGGLGLHTFRNAAHGGDWILQPALSNAPSIAKLLPPVAPLSTLRLVTASRASLHQRPAEASSLDEGGVEVLSACFRAGRAGASTDHSCVMFDVDVATGNIRRGTTSAHWYQLGLARARRCPLFSEGHTVEVHPDCGAPVCGEVIPDMASIASLVREAHRKLVPGVPLVGWDVAITAEAGVCLLEANLSCNFFRASFDERVYFAFAEALLGRLEGKAGRC